MSPFLAFTLKTHRFQNAPFSNLGVFIGVFEKPRWSNVNTRQKRRMTFENAAHSFVDRFFITMPFKVAMGALLTAINKRLCSQKGDY